MKRTLLILLITFLWPFWTNAQNNYYVQHYSGDNGLPQNSIKSLWADSEGFVWMGTEDGLVRYDGSRFYVFNRFNVGISDPRSLYAQPLLRKDPEAEKRGNYVKGRNAVTYMFFDGLESVRIERGKAVLDNNYSNHDHKKLEQLARRNSHFFEATGFPNTFDKLMEPSQYLLRTGNTDADFYLCDSTKIQYFENWKEKYKKPFVRKNVWNYFVMQSSLYRFDKENAGIIKISEHETVKKTLIGDILENPLYKPGRGNISFYWNNLSDQTFLFIGDDLYILEVRNDGSLFTTLLAKDFDLPSKGIGKIYYDHASKKLFLGSATDGLYILTRHQFRTVKINGDFLDNVFYAQLPFTANSVITADGRIVGYDPSSGKVIDKKFALIHKVNHKDKMILFRDYKGESLWTKDGPALWHIDLKNPERTKKFLFGFHIQTLHQDPKGRIWFGSLKLGLFLKKPGEEPKFVVAGPFINTTVISSYENHILVGTKEGLFDMDPDTRKYHLVPGTKNVQVKSIFIDKQKNLWLTALEKGIMLLKPDGCLISFPLDVNRYLASPHGIVPEADNFWIPTNKGLFQISKTDLLAYGQCRENENHGSAAPNGLNVDELYYTYHSKEEGFLTNEFNGSCEPGFARLENGYISLPSLNGLVWFKPAEIRNYQADGAIILDRAEENRKNLVTSNDSIYFPVNPSQVKLYFASAYFGNIYNMKMSYVLLKEGHVPKPEDWISIENENKDIEFSSLNSGNYTLLVRKLNGFGVNNYTIKKIYFVVPLLWYQTWWANVLIVILLVAGIYFYNLWRLKKVKFENARLEELVNRRTTRLNETLTDLEESKNEMARQVHMLSRLLTSMTHDIQSPLNFIKLISGNIPKMIKNGQYEEVIAVGEVISDSSRSMSDLLRGLLDYIKAHVYENSLHFEYINVRQLVDEKFAIFKNMILENRTNFSNEIPDDIEVYCDYQMLGIMIHNLIDNAAKFTRGGEIRVFINAVDDNTKELVISNTTVGVPMVLQEMINSTVRENVQLKGVSKPGPGQSRTSLGLLIVKEIASLVGINLKVTQSDVTRFHLIFGNGI